MFKVGVAEFPFTARYSPTALVRASYLTALAARTDSFWLADHLVSLSPRSIATPKYVGAARLFPRSTPFSSRGRCSGIWPREIASGGCGLVSG